jgi:4-hydroxybenzoate polyprenyltransferase/phosphoserine phosphatase
MMRDPVQKTMLPPQQDNPPEAGHVQSTLIVDLDGTLLRSDTLVEGIAAGLFQKPFQTLAGLASAPFSRAKFKSWVFGNIRVDYEAIPVNDDLVAHLKAQKAEGRAVHLVSAADQGVVDQVAQRFDVFDSAIGSRDGHNLKGRRKLALIQERFGADFVYAGDSPADRPIWKAARGAIYAGTDPSMARALDRSGPGLEANFARPAAGLKVWLKALRLHQWAKNLLLFAPLILAHKYDDPQAILMAVLGFLILGVTASGTYLVNDLSDLGSDRRHRSKRNRPLASARLPVASGLVAAPVLIGGGLVAAALLSWPFALALAAYLVVTLAYSLRFKRTPMLDVFILATLYTLRLVMGSAIIGVPFSIWLLTFSMFFFLSLSLAKRHVEVAAPGAEPRVKIRGRGYYPEDAPLTLGLGLATAVASVLILVLYLVEEVYLTVPYKSPEYLSALPVLIALWASRIWLLAHRGELDDDPVAFAVRDRVSLLLGAGMIACMAAAILL